MENNKTFISFYLRNNGIHVFCKAVREIGCPPYIRFLLHETDMKMIMEAYDKKEFVSFRVPESVYRKSGCMDLHSIKFCRLLAARLGWDTSASYRIPGIIYPNQQLVQFDLEQATMIRHQND